MLFFKINYCIDRPVSGQASGITAKPHGYLNVTDLFRARRARIGPDAGDCPSVAQAPSPAL
jgi:hypothetical protein